MAYMPEERRGLLYGITAYTLWGVFPLYWPLLEPSAPVEILAHRMVWSLVAVVGILALRRHWSWFLPLLRRPGTLALLTAAALIVSVNWGTYIYAVNAGRVVESSLGYFINPLVSIVFGVVLLRERLRRWQWVAVGLGALAVVVLTVDYGRPPWIALALAMTFGTYGLVKKKANVGAAESLAMETLVMLPPALAYLVVLEVVGTGSFGRHGLGHVLLIASTGIVTAVPLMCFTAAAIRIPLTTIGLLQYIAPVLQFLCGVLIVRETMPTGRWIGFGIVWVALAVLTWEGLHHAREVTKRRQPVRATT